MVEIIDESARPLSSSDGDAAEEKNSSLPSHESGVLYLDIQKAAYLVDQALMRRVMPLEVLQHKNYHKAKQAYATYNRLFYIRCVSLVILILLPFFEGPDWCRGNLRKGSCGDPELFLLSGVTYLQPWISTLIKFMCVLPLAISLILQRYYKFLTFWGRRSIWIKVGLMVTMGLHIVSSLAEMSSLVGYHSKQVGLYLCILIPIFFSRSLRNCFRMTLRIGNSFLDTAGVLVGFILLSAWLANLLFHNPNFEDFPTSLLSLFVMLTTANNPNVWAKTYEENHITFFFFFIYMIIGFFFLMHLLFALIYNNYKVQKYKSIHQFVKEIFEQLLIFWIWDGLELPAQLQRLCSLKLEATGGVEMRHVHDLGALVEDVVSSLRHKEGEKIIFGDFKVLCGKFVRAIEGKLRNRHAVGNDDKIQRWHCCPGFLASVGYAWLSFTVTLASLVVAILNHNIQDLGSANISRSLASKYLSSSNLLTGLEFSFGWLFFADLVLKFKVQGIMGYWNSILNRFDFVTTMVIICLQISTIWYLDAYDWISLSIMVRSIRVVSLLNYFNRWSFMGKLLSWMVPATVPILLFQFCVCSLFSVAGVHIFGGLVYVGNPRLESTEYETTGLWVYNYNDYGSAMVTSFNLCVVNNWYVIMDGYASATGSPWSRAYFITFWAIAVTFTLNVVVAFFVGAFTTQMEKAEQAHSLSLLTPESSKHSVLARRKVGTSMFMGYGQAFSKYDLYEEIVRR